MPCALLSNCSEIPNSCCRVYLALGKDIGDVLADIGLRGPEQLDKLRLSHPHRLAVKTNLHGRHAAVTPLEDDLTGVVSSRFMCHGQHSARHP
jgi:hypothetical protein